MTASVVRTDQLSDKKAAHFGSEVSLVKFSVPPIPQTYIHISADVSPPVTQSVHLLEEAPAATSMTTSLATCHRIRTPVN